MVAPCVDILRDLTRLMNGALGSEQGTLHAPVDLTADIPILMKSLKEHSVSRYTVQGRILNPDDGSAAPDVISVGLQNLTDSSRSPLVDYNRAFLDLQMRRRMKPLAPIIPGSGERATSPFIATHPTPPSPSSEPVHAATAMEIDMGSDDSDSDNDDGLFEGMTEFEKVMEENAEEDQTLTRNSSRDVALDMDADMLGGCSDEEGCNSEDRDMFDEFGAGKSDGEDDDVDL